jgi:hypothetical protein
LFDADALAGEDDTEVNLLPIEADAAHVVTVILRTLSEQEMDAYRAPFRERAARLPLLIWPRELPIEGEPDEIGAALQAFVAGLRT